MRPDLTPSDRNWGTACHLSALTLLLGIPLGNLLGPLIIWLVKRQEIPFVNDQGKQALNFQITLVLHATVVGLLTLILTAIAGHITLRWAEVSLLVVVAIALWFGLGCVFLIFTIIATLEASKGRYYRYPRALAIPFVR